MNVTITGATGLHRPQARASADGARRRRHGPLARPRQGAPRELGVAGRALGPGRRDRRRPPRWPAAMPSSTSPASPSRSAGASASSARSRESRAAGTRNLVAGLAAAEPRPAALVCASAVGYYGPRGDERLTEDAAPGVGLPRRRLRRVGARGAGRASSSALRVARDAHGDRARRLGRRAGRRC